MAILTLISPHIDRIGLAIVFAFVAFGWLSFLGVRRLERRLGLDGLTVQMTVASFGMMVVIIILYPIMSHQSHVWLHPHSKEYDHWEMLPMFTGIVPMALLFSNRLSRMREG